MARPDPKRFSHLPLIFLILSFFSFAARRNSAFAEPPRAQAWRKLQIPADKIAPFYYTNISDVNADGQKELVFAKQVAPSQGSFYFYVAAFDLNGQLLWENRIEAIDTGSAEEDEDVDDLPSSTARPKGSWQVGNMNEDPYLEVASVWKSDNNLVLRIISGKDGRVIAEAPIEERIKRLAIGDLQGRGFKGEIALGLGITKVLSVYSLSGNTLEHLCTTTSAGGKITGSHHIFYDVNGDSKEELFLSDTLYGGQCQKLWEAPSGGHADSTFIGEVDGNAGNGPEIFTVNGNQGVFRINRGGQIVWKKTYASQDHYQALVLGNLLGDLTPELIVKPSKPALNESRAAQKLIIDLDGNLKQTITVNSGANSLYPLNYAGQHYLLFTTASDGFYTNNGSKKALLPADGGPRQWILASDVQGDVREEIFMFGDDGRIWIYKNPEPAPCPLYSITKDWTKRGHYSAELSALNLREVPCTSDSLVGDLNNDGKVDMSDYLLFVPKYGTTEAACDFDHSGMVDIADYLIFVGNYGKVP